MGWSGDPCRANLAGLEILAQSDIKSESSVYPHSMTPIQPSHHERLDRDPGDSSPVSIIKNNYLKDAPCYEKFALCVWLLSGLSL